MGKTNFSQKKHFFRVPSGIRPQHGFRNVGPITAAPESPGSVGNWRVWRRFSRLSYNNKGVQPHETEACNLGSKQGRTRLVTRSWGAHPCNWVDTSRERLGQVFTCFSAMWALEVGSTGRPRTWSTGSGGRRGGVAGVPPSCSADRGSVFMQV